MMHIYLMGDGFRDATTVPHLLEKILETQIISDCHPWNEMHVRGGGYPRKLRLAVRQAIDARADGLVAVVDTDKMQPRARLKTMIEAREEDRSKALPFPTVLGEATPHGEAWLLDDEVAVRQGLKLPSDHQIPSVKKVASPKNSLGDLIKQSDRTADNLMEVLADVAKGVDPLRCNHAKETGFREFVEETRTELGPLASR